MAIEAIKAQHIMTNTAGKINGISANNSPISESFGKFLNNAVNSPSQARPDVIMANAVNMIQQINPNNMSGVVAQAFSDTIGSADFRKKKQIDTMADFQAYEYSGDLFSDQSNIIAQAVPAGPVVPAGVPAPADVPAAAPTGAVAEPADIMAQQLSPLNVYESLGGARMDITPFQLFLDKALEFFDGVSEMEKRADWLMEQYVLGKASIEELTIEKTKVSVALSFAVTLVNQITQSFKEIQNMAV
ncbi:flagellar hook-basal body complex protein FliE [Thermoproteota archaeon]